MTQEVMTTDQVRTALIEKLVQAGVNPDDLAEVPTIRLIDALYEQGYDKGVKRGAAAAVEAGNMDFIA